MYHKILVPLRGSEQPDLALPLAVEPAKIYKAENTLLRVVEYLFEIYSSCHPNVFNNPTHPSDNLGHCLLPVSKYTGDNGEDPLTTVAVDYQVQCGLSDVTPVRRELGRVQ